MNIIFDGIFNEENLNSGYAKIIEVNKKPPCDDETILENLIQYLSQYHKPEPGLTFTKVTENEVEILQEVQNDISMALSEQLKFFNENRQLKGALNIIVEEFKILCMVIECLDRIYLTIFEGDTWRRKT